MIIRISCNKPSLACATISTCTCLMQSRARQIQKHTACQSNMNAEQITAYLAATTDAKKWKGKLNKQKKRIKRQHASTSSSSDDDSEQPAKRPRVEHYCYCHETHYSHTSAECKVMQSDKKRFTSAMRNATDSRFRPGGSDRKPGAPYMR
jgi:hypothetical protein